MKLTLRHICALGLVTLSLYVGNLYGEEVLAKSEYLPLKVFFDELDDNPIDDYHEYIGVIIQYLEQAKTLEKKKNPSNDEKNLRDEMRAPQNLKRLMRCAEIKLEAYKDNPDLNPESRKQDITTCARAITAIRAELLAGEQNEGKVDGKPLLTVQMSAEDNSTILEFLRQFSLLLKEEKYVEVAQRYLEYNGEMPSKEFQKVQPQIIGKLENHVKGGCLDLLADLCGHKGTWTMTTSNDATLSSNGRVSGSIELHRDEKGGWKCRSITITSRGKVPTP